MELFVYMGKMLGQGGRIGIELIDNKLPTVSLVMWLPYQLIGAWWPGYALLSVVLACVGVWAIAKAAAEVHRSSLLPTAVMAAAWMSFPLVVFSAFKLEHLTVPLCAVAAWLFVRLCKYRLTRDAFLIGLVAGIAAMAKPNALAVLAAAGLVVVSWRELTAKTRFRFAAAMAVGVLIPAMIVLGYLVFSGAITALPAVYQQVRTYNQNSVWHWQLVGFKALAILFLLGLPFVMRSLGERRWAEPRESNLHTPVLWFALIWFAVEVIGVAMQGRMYGYHFLPITAPAALLFGLVPRRVKAFPLVVNAVPVLIIAVFWAYFAMLSTKTPADRLAAIDYIKSNTAAGDSVWIDENARILVETDLKPGSRIPLTFIFSNDDTSPTKYGGMLCDDLHNRRPKFVVLPTDTPGWAETGARAERRILRPPRARHGVAGGVARHPVDRSGRLRNREGLRWQHGVRTPRHGHENRR
ncbi:MAG: hypothetical protein QM754_16860 [Tepidisphaeraceae bacterium]